MLSVDMDPGFSLSATIFGIKFVFSTVGFRIPEECELAPDLKCVAWGRLDFAFEDAVYAEAFF
jgi:hypothetical protein